MSAPVRSRDPLERRPWAGSGTAPGRPAASRWRTRGRAAQRSMMASTSSMSVANGAFHGWHSRRAQGASTDKDQRGRFSLALGHDRLEPLVHHHGAEAAAAGLLEARLPALPVVERDVDAADEGVQRASSRGDDREALQLLVASRVHVVELPGHVVAVERLVRRRLDRHPVRVAVDDQQRRTPSALPRTSSASKPANLSSGPKCPPTLQSITEPVVGEIPGDQALAGAREVRRAAERPGREVEPVARVVPGDRAGDRVPHQVEVETLAAGEDSPSCTA